MKTPSLVARRSPFATPPKPQSGEGGWPDELVAVAEVLSPQGNKGEVKVKLLTCGVERFAAIKSLTARREDFSRQLTIDSWRPHGEYAVLGFSEITSISGAETLRDTLLCIPADKRAELPPGQFYQDDLLGLAAMTQEGRLLGRVVAIMTTKANDVLVVADPSGAEILLPATHEVIASVDLAEKKLIVRPLPGLLDQEDAP